MKKYTDNQMALLGAISYATKQIEGIDKERQEYKRRFIEESEFQPGELIQVDYTSFNATYKVRGWLHSITFHKDCPVFHVFLPKNDGSKGKRVKSIGDGFVENILNVFHIKPEDLKGGAK